VEVLGVLAERWVRMRFAITFHASNAIFQLDLSVLIEGDVGILELL